MQEEAEIQDMDAQECYRQMFDWYKKNATMKGGNGEMVLINHIPLPEEADDLDMRIVFKEAMEGRLNFGLEHRIDGKTIKQLCQLGFAEMGVFNVLPSEIPRALEKDYFCYTKLYQDVQQES